MFYVLCVRFYDNTNYDYVPGRSLRSNQSNLLTVPN